jgi:methylmalonyl-CoA mutase
MNEVRQLFESFTKPEKPDWKKAASSEISGANPSENLKWVTTDEQEFEPYYSQEDVDSLAYLQQFQLNGFNHQSPDARVWVNMPEIEIADEEKANELALEFLGLEAEGILFKTTGGRVSFTHLLNGIQWEHCSVSFFTDQYFPVTDLLNYISDKNYSYANLQGCIFWSNKMGVPPALPSHNGLKFLGIVAESSTPVNEIAAALVKAVQTIEDFTTGGHKVEEIIKHIAFSVPLSTQVLLDISKLKALRILWYQVVQAYGVKDYKISDLYIHGRSEKWINEKFQPHGNMLKGTVAAIAGISGGANAITIQPEEADQPMMTRIARNTSTILREESHLGKVNDPFAGAYGIEVLTDRIARDAWSLFQSKQ